jgi:hypothetical protein
MRVSLFPVLSRRYVRTFQCIALNQARSKGDFLRLLYEFDYDRRRLRLAANVSASIQMEFTTETGNFL